MLIKKLENSLFVKIGQIADTWYSSKADVLVKINFKYKIKVFFKHKIKVFLFGVQIEDGLVWGVASDTGLSFIFKPYELPVKGNILNNIQCYCYDMTRVFVRLYYVMVEIWLIYYEL